LIETCSRGITLYPGDVIATGTPAGVGMGMKPPQWLKTGDVVRIEVDGIGAIENRFE
jgi:2-keto-4-pentenoate hydratase/2-oxohepta-3-ene-1,7-dioic acid hydratase in catechol pathway